MIETIIPIVFGCSVIVGAGLVWATYAGLERSVAAGGSAFLLYSVSAIVIGRKISRHIAWTSWAQADMASLVAKIGAALGAAIIIVAFRPEYCQVASSKSPTDADASSRSNDAGSIIQED